VRLLLDSQVLLWFMAGSARLGRRALDVVSAPDSEVWISAATAWEIALKESLGRLELAAPAAEIIPDAIAHYGFRPLHITVEHGLSAAALPEHHKDPFDRMLIAQSRAEGLRIATADRQFAAYDVSIIDAQR
jgi:PIN domain nuclease of toxin-antitoxin system